MVELSTKQKLILNIIQSDFPIEEEPFSEIDMRLDFEEGTTLKEVKYLKQIGLIRQISPIYDTVKLGYKSTLVAFKIPHNNLLEGVRIINRHPGVSHNYERGDEYNIWFTVAVPPQTSLERTIEILAQKSRAEKYMILPTLKLFKIGVKLDVAGTEGMYEESTSGDTSGEEQKSKSNILSDEDIEFIKITQQTIPLENRPFDKFCRALNMTFQKLKDKFFDFKKQGIMRRFAAILRHRKTGFSVNAMVVWKLPENSDAQKYAQILTSFRAVSHCYLRPCFPDFPYSFYTMIHTKTREECDNIVNEMKNKTGLTEYKVLISTREFKKIRLVYFTQAFDKWNRENGLIDSE